MVVPKPNRETLTVNQMRSPAQKKKDLASKRAMMSPTTHPKNNLNTFVRRKLVRTQTLLLDQMVPTRKQRIHSKTPSIEGASLHSRQTSSLPVVHSSNTRAKSLRLPVAPILC